MPNIDSPSSKGNPESNDDISTTLGGKTSEQSKQQYDPEQEAQEQRDENREAARLLLQTGNLSNSQIEDVLDGLDQLGKGQKAKLTNSSGSASEEDSAWFYDAIEDVREVGKWPHPHLSEWKQGPVATVEVVVHPLFGPFIEHFDPKLWEESNGNPDKYLESCIVKTAHIALTKLQEDPTCIPLGYFLARDMIEEWEALKGKVPVDTLRVLDLSRRSLVPDQKRVQAYDAFLRSIEQDRTVAVDSFEPGTGLLQDKDLTLLNDIVGKGGCIEVQGGYLNACVDAAAHSIARMVHNDHRNDLRLIIDSAPSTGSSSMPDSVYSREELLSFDEQLSPEMIKEHAVTQDELNHLRAFQDTFIHAPKTEVSSIEDVQQWIIQNDEANQRYDNFIRFTGRLSTQSDDDDTVRKQYKKIQYK